MLIRFQIQVKFGIVENVIVLTMFHEVFVFSHRTKTLRLHFHAPQLKTMLSHLTGLNELTEDFNFINITSYSSLN